MMLFVVATAVLGVLGYFFLRSEDNEPPKEPGTKGTAHRDRELSRRKPAENKSPQIHRQKVTNGVEETLRRVTVRAQELLDKDKEEKLA